MAYSLNKTFFRLVQNYCKNIAINFYLLSIKNRNYQKKKKLIVSLTRLSNNHFDRSATTKKEKNFIKEKTAYCTAQREKKNPSTLNYNIIPKSKTKNVTQQ